MLPAGRQGAHTVPGPTGTTLVLSRPLLACRAPPPGSQPAALPPRGRPQPAGVKAAVPGVAGRPCAHGHDGGGHPPGLAGQGQLQDAQRVTGALREKEQDALTERRRTHVNAARPHEGSRGAGADPPGRGLTEVRVGAGDELPELVEPGGLSVT